jgi:hypothetical protein
MGRRVRASLAASAQVTNAVHVLSRCDRVLVLDGGRLVAQVWSGELWGLWVAWRVTRGPGPGS